MLVVVDVDMLTKMGGAVDRITKMGVVLWCCEQEHQVGCVVDMLFKLIVVLWTSSSSQLCCGHAH